MKEIQSERKERGENKGKRRELNSPPKPPQRPRIGQRPETRWPSTGLTPPHRHNKTSPRISKEADESVVDDPIRDRVRNPVDDFICRYSSPRRRQQAREQRDCLEVKELRVERVEGSDVEDEEGQ